MKMPVAAALLLASAIACADLPTAPVTCNYGAPNPEAPKELSQFAFLIGDYRVHLHAYRNGAWTPPQPGVTARWNGRYGLNGLVIEDEWFHPDPAQQEKAGGGINVRMYDDEAGEWKMMWVATAGKQVQDLRAEMRDGVLTMWQVYPERPNFQATFHIDDADNWHRISYIPDEKGGWLPQFKLAATRLPCPAE